MVKKSATAEKEVKHVDLYGFDDLVEGYKEFGYPKECVMAALKFNGVVQTDVETARKIVKKFMERVIV